MHITLPLLHGMFVLVAPAAAAAAALHTQTDGGGDVGLGDDTAQLIPWRLRQILSVEVAAGDDPADAAVVLVGGQRVAAGSVCASLLADVADYEVR